MIISMGDILGGSPDNVSSSIMQFNLRTLMVSNKADSQGFENYIHHHLHWVNVFLVPKKNSAKHNFVRASPFTKRAHTLALMLPYEHS